MHVHLHLQLLFKQLENVKKNEYVISITLETALRTSSYSQRNITYVLALMPKGLVARIQISIGRLIWKFLRCQIVLLSISAQENSEEKNPSKPTKTQQYFKGYKIVVIYGWKIS